MSKPTMIALAVGGTMLLMSISLFTVAWRQAKEVESSWEGLEDAVEREDAAACYEHEAELEVHYFNPITSVADVFFDIRPEPTGSPCADLRHY